MENKNRKRIVKTVLLAGMAVCLIPVGQAYHHFVQHKVQQEGLREMRAEAPVQYPVQEDRAPQKAAGSVLSGAADKENMQTENNPVMLAGYAGLYEKNKDLAGWISIEGMKIDYPVMQTEDNTYYLHHDFYGEDSPYGCLYVKEQADLDAGTNFVIYGHNMRDGSMFGDLDLYLKESFYKEHPVISFDTLYEERTYDIIAVFRSQVYNANDDVFKYYQFYEADTQEEFEYFYTNIKELSLYDTGVEAEFGDTFLTLSTCAYHVEDGRLVVVAKRTE
ncbi:MAG: class B sortase [Muribaculaceae bacterium]|nr:class B sortase [Roseburia sp.]MCM1430263.1 class B sortase [Muribaculaceae bacterium]MCM1492628.1 class B sortase [Muribaculaceae bacterium]